MAETPLNLSKTSSDPPPDPPDNDDPKTGFDLDGDGPIAHDAGRLPREIQLELHLRLKVDGRTLTLA